MCDWGHKNQKIQNPSAWTLSLSVHKILHPDPGSVSLFLLHFDSKDFPESSKWRGNSTLKADHVSKDNVNIKYVCVINYKISFAVFSANINLAHLNCKYMDYDTVNV